jgi:hypothetical protein
LISIKQTWSLRAMLILMTPTEAVMFGRGKILLALAFLIAAPVVAAAQTADALPRRPLNRSRSSHRPLSRGPANHF